MNRNFNLSTNLKTQNIDKKNEKYKLDQTINHNSTNRDIINKDTVIMDFSKVIVYDDNDNIKDSHKELYKEFAMLQELNLEMRATTVDEEIIKETNDQLDKIKRELIELQELMVSVNELIVLDGEKLDQAEENIIVADELITDTIPILEEIKEINNNYDTIKTVGGALLGGVVLGGVGSIFGIIPGVVCVGIGTGGGAIAGYLSKFIKI